MSANAGPSAREPVCLGCAWDRYKDQYDAMTDHREWPTTPKTCHVCGMTTEMGYSVTTPERQRQTRREGSAHG